MNNTISICIIGKNEEKHIENCLAALAKLPFPVIYTDTGSTDKTVSIAAGYTDQIYHYLWQNDFAAARNFCAGKAKTDWVWFVDCDEYLEMADTKQILALCREAEQNKHFFIGMVNQKDSFCLQNESCYAVTRLGRFYHRKACHYEGIIHEQIVPLRSDISVTYQNLDALFVHHSYSDRDIASEKAARNITLLQEALSKGTDPYLYYQLGQAYRSVGENMLAADAYSKGLSFDLDPCLSYVQSMVEAYGYTLLDLKRYEEALSFTAIENTFSVRADFVFLMGLIYMHNAQFARAIASFEKATTFPGCVVEGVNSYRAFYNIGVIYEVQGFVDKAREYYTKCHAYPPAVKRLGALSQ